MRSRTRQFDRLLDHCFAERAVFRMGFDAHVKLWRQVRTRQAWPLYHTDPAFTAAYDARVEANRSLRHA